MRYVFANEQFFVMNFLFEILDNFNNFTMGLLRIVKETRNSKESQRRN